MVHPTSFVIEIGAAAAGLRLDHALARTMGSVSERQGLPRLSRTRLRKLIDQGAIESITNAELRLDPTRIARAGERFRIMQPANETGLEPDPVPLEIVYEDPHLLVVNKAPGMLVHPAHKGHTGTLAHAVLAHCGRGLSTVGHPLRPGIVHRLDVGTGGLLVVAKQESVRLALAELFAAHDIEREYLAIAWGEPARSDALLANRPGVSFRAGGWIRVDAPVGPDPRQPSRRAVIRHGGKRALTHLRLESPSTPGSRAPASLLRCRLGTGRTHQIRVHLTWIGHPLVGDRAYGRAPTLSPSVHDECLRQHLATFSRPALHAYRLEFRHPETGEAMRFKAMPHSDFLHLAKVLGTSLPPGANGTTPAAIV